MSNLPIISDYDGELSASPARSGASSRQISPFQVLWRGRWIVLLCTTLAVGGGYIYLSLQTPIYSSSSRIDVETQSLPSLIEASETHNTNYLATQCELIKSAQILGSVSKSPEIGSMKTFDGVDDAIGKLKGGVSATTSKLDDLITVSFESPYPSEAALVTNAIVDSYLNYHAKLRRQSAAEALRILAKEKRDRDNELEQKLKDMTTFKQVNPNLSYAGDGKTNIILEALAKMSDALNTARLEVLQTKAEYEGAVAMSKDDNKREQWMKLQESGPNNTTAAEIRRLKNEIETLKETLGAGNSTVKSYEAQMRQLKADMRQQSQDAFDGYLSAMNQRYETAQQHEAEIRSLFDEKEQLALALNSKNAEYQMMDIDSQRLMRESELLDSRIKEAHLTEESGGAMNITVLETARPSGSPIKPKWSVVLFEAVAAGLALGGGLAYLRELMDHRLRSVEDIRTTLNLAVLGAVPRMAGKEAMAIRGQKVQIEPMSNIAEAYRTIRTAIYFSAREEKARTIVVTSPAPGDGKSTSASNLAISMAQAGQRVLLMDADLRKPVQHKIFKLDDAAGLTSVVNGKSPLSEAVKLTDIPGLYVLPSGPIPRNPAEVLTSAAFEKILDKLRTKFDHIVIDSPPVAPVTDAGILGGLCDATIIVVRANKSTRRVSLQAVNYLMSVGSKMLGVIANEVGSNDGNYGYHGYGYGYYSTRGVLTTKHVKSIEGNGHAHEEMASGVGASRE